MNTHYGGFCVSQNKSEQFTFGYFNIIHKNTLKKSLGRHEFLNIPWGFIINSTVTWYSDSESLRLYGDFILL